MPQVKYNDVSPWSSTAIVQGSTYNAATGNTSYSTYSGQAVSTPSPGAAFAGGIANGMNIGAAFAASRAQERIYKACMYAQGWSDSSRPKDLPAVPPSSRSQSNAIVPQTEDVAKIYATPEAAWLADVDEFLTVYPAYRVQPLYGRLNDLVKRIALEDSLREATGPQILLAAHDALVQRGQGSAEPEEGTAERYVTLLYRDAASNNVAAQNALGTGFLKGWNPLPQAPKRAIFWFQRSALAGNPMGQTGYGVMLFEGKGVESNREQGYHWVSRAASAGDKSAKELLGRLQEQMTRDR
ncbi:tetratricopeptide repeat protein [Cupriavidus campinensis]|uniref:tetratricopeptide repeat protein n=2 Tax=Cupriavidus campinensis TaxID=151783 RepID=UPI0024E207FB|nr:tetratricopeptide repeat protein [Cupriavidus campinensis]